MDKVVILGRVSTDHQDYQRQVNELQDYCGKVGWEVVSVFTNKVSGAKSIEERTELQEMIQFIKENEVSRVVCLEVSRLGRNTLESLKVIQILSEHKVSLYIKNYNLETLNPDGSPNPITSLITTILLEISSMERLTIRERMRSGQEQYISKCRREGIKMGRPSTYRKSDTEYREQYSKDISLLKKGISLRNIRSITGTSLNTLRKLKSIYLLKPINMEKELNLGQICSICGNPIDGYGHNSQPVKEGRCCDKCNEEVVKVRWNEFYNAVMTGEI